jgi:hypothetical protein
MFAHHAHRGFPCGLHVPAVLFGIEHPSMPVTRSAVDANDPPTSEELVALLRLLDDDTPEVRERVAQRLVLCGGDLSDWLAAVPHQLSGKEKFVLSEMLGAARRDTLEREWSVPSGGAAALTEDWEALESMLRLISDFLHDGITLRQSLSDALDLLAEEAWEHPVVSPCELGNFLFGNQRFVADDDGEADPKNLDLAWVLAEGHSHSLGLCMIFLLVGHRMEFDVEIVDYPGRFLCRIHEEGHSLIVDCVDGGQIHLQSALLVDAEITREGRERLRGSVAPGSLLCHWLDELGEALCRSGRDEDSALIQRLRDTLD